MRELNCGFSMLWVLFTSIIKSSPKLPCFSWKLTHWLLCLGSDDDCSYLLDHWAHVHVPAQRGGSRFRAKEECEARWSRLVIAGLSGLSHAEGRALEANLCHMQDCSATARKTWPKHWAVRRGAQFRLSLDMCWVYNFKFPILKLYNKQDNDIGYSISMKFSIYWILWTLKYSFASGLNSFCRDVLIHQPSLIHGIPG